MRQNAKRRMNNRHYGSHMKSMIKLILGHVEKGEMDKAKKVLPEVISAIDTAAKKRLIHENNAAHKKSRVQIAVTAGPPKKEDKLAKKEKAEKVDAPLDEKDELGKATKDSTDVIEEAVKKDD